VQFAAAFAALGKWQAADLAERIALALARPAVADPAAHLEGILLRLQARLPEFVDDQLDRGCRGAVGLVACRPARRHRQVKIFPQVYRPDLECGHQPIVRVKAGLGAAILELRYGVDSDADLLCELGLREAAVLTDTA